MVNGVQSCELDLTVGIKKDQIRLVIASGMITSELGLIEIPHLIAPAGLEELSNSVKVVYDPKVIDLGVPVYFIRGIRNDFGSSATLDNIMKVDFLRGEEVQCIGILSEYKPKLPVNIVVLSSHTKIIHIGRSGKVLSCMTTMSGQIYEALKTATNVGSSLIHVEGEPESGVAENDIVNLACESVENTGFTRAVLVPRFMQVLLNTSCRERTLFIDAVITTEDIKALIEFENQGFLTDNYILFGPEGRQKLYKQLFERYVSRNVDFLCVSDPQRISDLTVLGATVIANQFIKKTDIE